MVIVPWHQFLDDKNLSQKKNIYIGIFFWQKNSTEIKISHCHTKIKDLFTWCSQYDEISFTFHVMEQLWQWLLHHLKINQKAFTANGFEKIVPSILTQYGFMISLNINMPFLWHLVKYLYTVSPWPMTSTEHWLLSEDLFSYRGLI